MIDWETVKDWAPIAIALIAVIVSLVTLYIAHLRGPNIRLADPGDLISPERSTYERNENIATLAINLLVINLGNRSGIVHKLEILKGDLFVQAIYKEHVNYPFVVHAGQGFHILPVITIAKPADLSWKDTFRNRDYVTIEVTYNVNTGIFWNRSKKSVLKIDIKDLKL
jgi:hypothetical protein